MSNNEDINQGLSSNDSLDLNDHDSSSSESGMDTHSEPNPPAMSKSPATSPSPEHHFLNVNDHPYITLSTPYRHHSLPYPSSSSLTKKLSLLMLLLMMQICHLMMRMVGWKLGLMMICWWMLIMIWSMMMSLGNLSS